MKLLLIILLLLCNIAYSQINKKTSVSAIGPSTAEGYLPSKEKLNIIRLYYGNDGILKPKMTVFNLKRNVFYHEFELSGPSYIRVNLLEKMLSENEASFYKLNHYKDDIHQFVEPGDSVVIEMIDSKNKLFSGRGFEKFLCLDSLSNF